MRLRQEREDLQKYLHELKDLRLESGSTRSYFRPLEFPKIAAFTQPGNLNKDIFINNELYNYLSIAMAPIIICFLVLIREFFYLISQR